MATKETRFDPGQILEPALPCGFNRKSPVNVGNSLTIARGQAMARKTSDGKHYPLNLAATDGTQTFSGFAAYAFASDSNGLVYLVFGGTTGQPTFYSPPLDYAEIFTSGIFDPVDLLTAATGTIAAEVDTLTPTSPTTGDIYTIGLADGAVASFTVGATQTAAAVVTGLTNAWNANPVLKALATPSGSSTFILTGTTKGQSLNLQAGVAGTGTTALVITTAATDAQQAEVDTFTPNTVTTGDVNTLTATFGGAQTRAVSFTIGATQTAAAASAGLIAAWNADPVLSNLATASGTNTVVLTAVLPGNAMSVAGSVVGTGTISKVVTSPAFGDSITDILPGNPGAHILQPYGYWELP